MMIDVDCFKKYNDYYGHIIGDNCLKSIALTLSNSVRRGEDLVVRYGGEEFAVLLPNSDENGARYFAEKLLNKIRELRIPHADSTVADFITVSIGVAVGIPSVDDNTCFIESADNMLYKSKENGRDRYTLINLGNIEGESQRITDEIN
jgi:diguanylate cyclase (GGDEF)-like protein